MTVSQNDYLTFMQYWQRLCAQNSDRMPERHHFRPAEIAPLLPYIFMLEVKEPDILEVRIAGTALDALSQEPMTGRNYLDVCPPHERQDYWNIMQIIHRVPCGSMLTREVIFKDRQVYTLKSLKFPLMDAATNRRYVAGLLAIASPAYEIKRPVGGAVKSTIIDQHYVDGGFGVPGSGDN